ncbi:hypothetical protein BC834DRAFT_855073 [Gloeopeniophorella convolvens]|nr:hypothetical protein BC834DRAFT_855073 [Gloeopeniophorella convolvens]
MLLLRTLVPLAALVPFAASRLLHSLPDDPFAFPKYTVSFLNGLPVLNETAERWLREGLRGGEAEFLDQPTPWKEPSVVMHIDAGDGTTAAAQTTAAYTLEVMKMGLRDTYLCLIPPYIEQELPPPEEPTTEVTVSHSWSLLQPLDGSCIYHRQGWFTYAYCHNSHVRQFREMIHPHPMTPGRAYEIEEDPDWEAYDLGRAPEHDPGADLSNSEQAALAANLELARGAGSRYLVQRWGDGTLCDKTGKHREIEVQFHCSMTMTDSIMFVKETKTCHYVLVINTPRLCSEPGFKSRIDQRDEALIRCRQVVDATTLANVDTSLPEADHPFSRRRTPGVPPLDAAAAPGSKPPAPDGGADTQNNILRRALETILQKTGAGGAGAPRVVVEDAGDGEMLIEFVSEIDLDGADGEDLGAALRDTRVFEDALRAAGFDVRDEPQEPSDTEAPRTAEEMKTGRRVNGAAKGRRHDAQPDRDEL